MYILSLSLCSVQTLEITVMGIMCSLFMWFTSRYFHFCYVRVRSKTSSDQKLVWLSTIPYDCSNCYQVLGVDCSQYNRIPQVKERVQQLEKRFVVHGGDIKKRGAKRSRARECLTPEPYWRDKTTCKLQRRKKTPRNTCNNSTCRNQSEHT